jgi:zinc-binding in reverse transcriptase
MTVAQCACVHAEGGGGESPYTFLKFGRVPNTMFQPQWKLAFQLKIRGFMWLALQNRIFSKGRVAELRLGRVPDCSFCQSQGTAQRLFLECFQFNPSGPRLHRLGLSHSINTACLRIVLAELCCLLYQRPDDLPISVFCVLCFTDPISTVVCAYFVLDVSAVLRFRIGFHF